jgi:hypothetical protein
VLIDWHCDQHKNAESACFNLCYFCGPVALAVHELCEVIGSLLFDGLEGKVHLSRLGENVAQFGVFPKQIRVRYRRLSEQVKHCHRFRILIEERKTNLAGSPDLGTRELKNPGAPLRSVAFSRPIPDRLFFVS